MKKSKIIDIAICVLIIIVIALVVIIYIKLQENKKAENTISEVVDIVETLQQDMQQEVREEAKQKLEETTIQGYKIEGIIEIPKIELKYPIINETSNKAMKVSVTKFFGGNINETGNYTIAGHNNLDGTMFGKVKKLEIGDIIKLTDLYGETVEYKIFDKYVIDPNDVSCTNIVQEGTKEVTLITCTNGNKNRLITKAREI